MKRALIVDDDDGVREGNKFLAQSKGYETVETDNYDHAAEIVGKERFDVYIIDGLFPDSKIDRTEKANGPRLYELILSLYPDAKILLLSGNSYVESRAKEKGWKFIIKGQSINKEF